MALVSSHLGGVVAMKRFGFAPLIIIAALMAVPLLMAACGGEEEEAGAPTAASPGASATAVGDRTGVTDTQILLGTHLPLSQTLAAAFAPVGDGMQAYFAYINDTEGGVYGRKIKVIVGDDHYNPPDTVEVVRKLVEQDKVFAIVSGLGDETHAAVLTYLEENGVPDMFLATGVHRYTEPPVKTRFGGLPDYQVEGRMLGKYVADHYNGAKIGILRENNEMGVDGLNGVNMGLEGSDVEIVADEKCEATTADVTAQAQRLKNGGAEVIISVAGPVPSASLLQVARAVLAWDVPILVSGVDCSDIFIALAGAENAEGVISVVFGHQVYETDLPGIQKHIEMIKKYAPNVEPSNYTLYGAITAELMVESLKRAGPDLTREKLVDAAESIRDWMCSVCMTPINMSPTDHRPFEIEVYNKVEGGKWVAFGEPVNFETTKD
jgi:branched-chain amino acid transport system substrate-binding protein